MLLLLMAAAAFISDDVSFANLGERKIVQLITQRDESLYRAVKGVEDDKLTVVDVGSLEEQTFEKSELKAIRRNLTDNAIAEGVGVGTWLAWQLQPIFDGAEKRQTVASIQQTAVFVTGNPYSGLMVGDEVDVFRLGDPIKDPNSGEILEAPEQKIAKLEVVSFSEKLMTCRATGEFLTELKVGDVVRPVQPRTSVAVLPFMNNLGQTVESGMNIADETTNALANLGIPTLERSRTVEILGEQWRQLSLVYEGGDASRVGKLLGAATLVTGRLIRANDKRNATTLSVRLLDVRTGVILKSMDLEMTSSKLRMTVVSSFSNGHGHQSAYLKSGDVWIGLAMPMKGPNFKVEVSEITIKIAEDNETGFQGIYEWACSTNAGRQNHGSHEMSGQQLNGRVSWIGDNSSHGTLKDSMMLLDSAHGEYFAEFWLIPKTDAMRRDVVAGTYTVSERGKGSFKLTLNADGTARKSHAPEVLGRWLGTNLADQILVCWTDGWRDVLTKEQNGWKKEAFPPAVSLAGKSVNPGFLTKTN